MTTDRERSLKSPERLSSMIQKLEREITCQFCLGPLNDPRMMECLHYFCKMCIQGMQIKSSAVQQLYKCPQCQKRFTIPNVEHLQKHNITNIKQRDLKLLRQISTEKLKCNLCPVPHKAAAEAVYICIDCRDGQRFICHDCSTAHYKKPELQDHQLELVTTIQADGISNNARLTMLRRSSFASNICNAHGYHLQYFCQSCQISACQECVSELHKDHTIGEADDVLQELQDLIPTEMLFTLGIRDSLLASIKPIQGVKTRIAHQKDFLSSEIHSRVLRIFKDLEHQETILQQQLQSTAQAKNDMLSLQLAQIRTLIERADQLSQMMSDVDKITNQSDILSLSQILLKKGAELRKDFESVAAFSTSNVPKTFSSFNRKPSLTPCEAPNMGLILNPDVVKKSLMEESKIFKMTAYPENCSAVGPGLQRPEALKLTYFNVYLRDVHNNLCVPQQNLVVTITTEKFYGKPLKSKIIYKGNGLYMITYCPKVANTHVINATVNEKHIKDSPFLVTVTTASPLANISDNFSSLEMLRKPCWLSRDSKDNVIVCDRSSPSSVLVLNEVGHEVLRIEEEQNSKLKHPCGVAVGSNNSIYICGSYCHCILKYNANGKVLQIAGKIGKGKGEFQNPAGLAVTENGEVFVCDTSNFRIQVFDEELQYKREISTDLTRFGHQRLTRPSHPHDIAIDNSHQMFVADTNNHCILVYKSQDQFAFPIWDAGENLGNLKNPRCVTVDNDGCLYVSDEGES